MIATQNNMDEYFLKLSFLRYKIHPKKCVGECFDKYKQLCNCHHDQENIRIYRIF